jgi:hypothetical protein
VLAGLIFFIGSGTPATVARGKGLVIDKSWLTNSAGPITPAEHRRPPDQTFLTYPEWFLVFGPAEQADFFQGHTSTKFPFMTHVRQIWQSYRIVYDQIRDNFPFNGGYHVMIVVIATSSTAEFGLKAIYETLIGRLTDTRDGEAMTEEDQFNAKLTRDYVDFIETVPWYEFDFKSRLKKFWSETSLFGAHPLRKWERKYILTTELVVKTVYGWLIGLGTKTAYEQPLLTTAVVVDRLPAEVPSKLPDLKVLQSLPGNSAIVTLPRYAPFNSNACELARANVVFEEIAGNTSAILVTVLAPRDWAAQSDDFEIIFTQSLPTRPEIHRVALATPVNRLHKTLQQLLDQKIEIEHVYDF